MRLPNGRNTFQSVSGLIWLEQLLQNLRYSVRMLRRSPGFAVVVVPPLARIIHEGSSYGNLVGAPPGKTTEERLVQLQ